MTWLLERPTEWPTPEQIDAALASPGDRILVTGDRHWGVPLEIERFLWRFNPRYNVLIHGGATGADLIADGLCRKWGWNPLSDLTWEAADLS